MTTATMPRLAVPLVTADDPLDVVRAAIERAVCDYCASHATHITRDGNDILCKGCGKDQYRDPHDALAILTPRTLAMYGNGREI